MIDAAVFDSCPPFLDPAERGAGFYPSSRIAGVSRGNTYCWGFNFAGSLGDGTTTLRTEPTRVRPITVTVGTGFGPFARTRTVTIPVEMAVAGGRHSCALTRNNEPFCWGHWDYLGSPPHPAVDPKTPVAVASPE